MGEGKFYRGFGKQYEPSEPTYRFSLRRRIEVFILRLRMRFGYEPVRLPRYRIYTKAEFEAEKRGEGE